MSFRVFQYFVFGSTVHSVYPAKLLLSNSHLPLIHIRTQAKAFRFIQSITRYFFPYLYDDLKLSYKLM